MRLGSTREQLLTLQHHFDAHAGIGTFWLSPEKDKRLQEAPLLGDIESPKVGASGSVELMLLQKRCRPPFGTLTAVPLRWESGLVWRETGWSQ